MTTRGVKGTPGYKLRQAPRPAHPGPQRSLARSPHRTPWERHPGRCPAGRPPAPLTLPCGPGPAACRHCISQWPSKAAQFHLPQDHTGTEHPDDRAVTAQDQAPAWLCSRLHFLPDTRLPGPGAALASVHARGGTGRSGTGGSTCRTGAAGGAGELGHHRDAAAADSECPTSQERFCTVSGLPLAVAHKAGPALIP